MADPREIRTVQTDSVSTDPGLPEPWQPVSDFEEQISKSLRRLDGARKGYLLERGNLTEDEQLQYDGVLIMLRQDIQRVIGVKETARQTGVDQLPGIGLVQDGVNVILTVPSLSQHHAPKDILLPIEELGEEAQNSLPPISESAVSKGLENAVRKVETADWHFRHTDGDWETVESAMQDKLKRVLVILAAKHDGQLPGIGISLSEDGEKVTLILPRTASRSTPLPIETTLKALETLEPNVRDLLFPSPAPSQG